MSKLEKFGSFVLLEEVSGDYLGRIYRAAKLGQAGFEKLVYLNKINPNITHDTGLVKSLIEELKACAHLNSPNITRVYGCGKIEGAYFISWEFVEGKDLGIVFTRMGDGFPLALDQSLYILSRIIAALETAHAAKIDDRPLIHGALSPVDILLTYEGDVKVKNFSVANVLSKYQNERKEAYKKIETYLSPEFLDGKPPERRSDIYALGLVFFRMLTGDPFFTGNRDIDFKQRLEDSRLMVPYQDEDRIPANISDFILRCLNPSPAGRFPTIKDVRQAVEALLLSGDFAPSTFNLAFFMHTAFRTEIENEMKQLQEEKKINFLEYIVEPASAPATPPPAKSPLDTAITQVLQKETHPEKEKIETKSPVTDSSAMPTPSHRPSARPATDSASASITFLQDYAEPKKKSPMVLIAVIAAIAILVAAGSYFLYFKPKWTGAAQTAAANQQQSSDQQKRLKELEEQAKKAEEDKARIGAELDSLKKQQEDALKKAASKAEQDRLATELAKKMEEKKKQEEADRQRQAEQETLKKGQEDAAAQAAADAARIAEEKKKADDEAAKKAAELQAQKESEQQLSQIKEGQICPMDSLDTKPTITRSANPLYPLIAQRINASGTVSVSVLVSETGEVIDTKIVKSSKSKFGFDESAVEAARKYKFTIPVKAGKHVKVWFTLPTFTFKPGR